MINAADLALLRMGEPPSDGDVLSRMSVGINFITDFWQELYLENYIALGGSKLKFLTGTAGSGKSHCLRLFLCEAEKSGFCSVALSAKQVWLHDFKEIYTAVLEKVDLTACLTQAAGMIIAELGYRKEDIPPGMNFSDYMISQGAFDPTTKLVLRQALGAMFYKNTRIDRNFATGASLLVGNILGYPALEPATLEILLSWMYGQKGAKAAVLRKLGMSPEPLSKHNARHMLRSLVEILRLVGYKGLVVGIDDVDTITNTSVLGEIRYTKMRQEDAFESIRELIDEIDTMSYLMFVMAFNRVLIDDEKFGFKSYQALWMRMQNEIESDVCNRFQDIIDLDHLARQHYNERTYAGMSEKLAAVLTESSETELNPVVVSEEWAGQLIAEDLQNQAMPRRIVRITLGGDSDG
jgi:hypothetical protein